MLDVNMVTTSAANGKDVISSDTEHDEFRMPNPVEAAKSASIAIFSKYAARAVVMMPVQTRANIISTLQNQSNHCSDVGALPSSAQVIVV